MRTRRPASTSARTARSCQARSALRSSTKTVRRRMSGSQGPQRTVGVPAKAIFGPCGRLKIRPRAAALVVVAGAAQRRAARPPSNSNRFVLRAMSARLTERPQSRLQSEKQKRGPPGMSRTTRRLPLQAPPGTLSPSLGGPACPMLVLGTDRRPGICAPGTNNLTSPINGTSGRHLLAAGSEPRRDRSARRDAEPELDEISAALADTIHEHLAELDEDMRTWTLQAARANLGVIVTMMREGDDPRVGARRRRRRSATPRSTSSAASS